MRQGAEVFSPPGVLAASVDLEAAYATWRAQAEWHVSKLTGDDSATGADAAHKIKTWAELRRRMGPSGIQGASTIYVYDDIDDITIDWACSGSIVVIAVTSLVRAGTLTAAPQARAGNLPNEITDATVADWTADIGVDRLLVFTDGPVAAVGGACWVAKNLGANRARVSTHLGPWWTEAQPVNGNAYEIRKLVSVGTHRICPIAGNWEFRRFNFASGWGGGAIGGKFGATWVQLTECRQHTAGYYAADVGFYNCATNPAGYGLFGEVCFLIQDGGIVFGATSRVGVGSLVQSDMGALFQACGITVESQFSAVDVLFFDAPGSAIDVRHGGHARLYAVGGSGAAAYGLLLREAGGAEGRAACAITGVTNDVKVGTLAAQTWAAVAGAGYYVADTGSACAISPG